jgi:hypothetical protein
MHQQSVLRRSVWLSADATIEQSIVLMGQAQHTQLCAGKEGCHLGMNLESNLGIREQLESRNYEHCWLSRRQCVSRVPQQHVLVLPAGQGCHLQPAEDSGADRGNVPHAQTWAENFGKRLAQPCCGVRSAQQLALLA